MDLRGIEVTNQLRSAIRAKLLELGVRYDEELPDYILVMVVNKKTRLQMHEDLHLFLEDSTAPFVEWLHDQVLKKLQKVTIAKKKATREFVPTVVVKQEEERKKRKNIAATVTEDPVAPSTPEKLAPIVTKNEKMSPKILEKSSPVLKLSVINPPNLPKPDSEPRETVEIHSTKTITSDAESTKRTADQSIIQKPSETATEPKTVESRIKITTKRPFEPAEHDSERSDKRIKAPSMNSNDLNIDDKHNDEDKEKTVTKDDRRLKSCVNKPKITSVVSVKNRLGIVSPRKKNDTHQSRDLDNRHRQTEKRFDKTAVECNRFDKNYSNSNRFDKNTFVPLDRRTTSQRSKTLGDEEIPLRNRNNDSRSRQTTRINEGRNRLSNSRDNGRFGKSSDTNDDVAVPRLKFTEKQASTVKNRLGLNKNIATTRQSIVEQFSRRDAGNTIKNRLGMIRNHIGFFPLNKNSIEQSDDDNAMEGDDDRSVVNVGPVKSHVIALNRPETIDKRSGKSINDGTNDLEEELDPDEGKSIASKVIVTPRPLKPLQPTQKRATQSLLLRAVAEANQSVVKHKNPEPVMSDKKPKMKRPQPPGTREIGKNLSVHLNAKKRLVMEKIQVQLRTTENEDNGKTKPHTPQPVNDEHMGVVMSLFQRSDDNQKFLVTLNGYNNNVVKENSLTDEEDERLEMEVTEDDELVLSNVQNVSYEQKESSPITPEIVEPEETEVCEKPVTFENNENHNTENVKTPEEPVQRKRRKLSPIVYTRTTSPIPAEVTKTLTILSGDGRDTIEQRIVNEVPSTTVTDKSREKCRFWPNCTVGSKCAYYHPAVPCGAFPACKFGDKCVYKHPKCKFGLSCTKLGCVFSHPKQQCKYHPFCTKPKCPYSHPPANPVVPTEAVRAKFTWKRRD